MASDPNSVLLGSALGIASSAMFFGGNLAISFITVPTLLLPSPSSTRTPTKSPHLARQWKNTYDLGKKAGPFFALTASGCWLYTVRNLPAGAGLQQRLLVAAAGLSMSVVPFTFGVMNRTNNELDRRAGVATKGGSEDTKSDAQKGTVESYETHDLLRWWAQLNMM